MSPFLVTLLLAAPLPAVSKEDRLLAVAHRILARYRHVEWRTGEPLVGDITLDRRDDAIALGTAKDTALVAILPGPVSSTTQPILLRFGPPKDAKHPKPGDLCGDPHELTMALEQPGQKPSDLLCAGKRMTPECDRLLKSELFLQRARRHNAVGIKLRGDRCGPLHVFFDGRRFRWWRGEQLANP